jgi:5-(carboxyamino)imidazole ribonucleotide mutase
MVINEKAKVALLMGSKSDWPQMEHAANMLEEFGVEFEVNAISAHRCHHHLADYMETVNKRELHAVICAAGGAAHLAGVTASLTTIPVLGVPMDSKPLKGMDSLLSTVQMPGGIPVATFAIGKPGAINAALFAIAQMAVTDNALKNKLQGFREKQQTSLLENTDPRG